jgi:hypothetical protein
MKSSADLRLIDEINNNPEKKNLRVWWRPQVPCKAFEVPVRNVAEGILLTETLARYDIFQLENNIKPDYANAGGLLVEEDGEWVDYCYEDLTEPGGHYFEYDELVDFVKAQRILPDTWDAEPVT